MDRMILTEHGADEIDVPKAGRVVAMAAAVFTPARGGDSREEDTTPLPGAVEPTKGRRESSGVPTGR